MSDYDVSATPGGCGLQGQVAVVTGAGQGIGRALVQALIHEEVGAVVAFDRDVEGLAGLADTTQGPTRVVTRQGDVTVPGEIEQLVHHAEREFGSVDLFCSNAGVMTEGGTEVPDALWQRSWEVNVMAHVHAARAVLPGMVGRSRGVLLNVLSAASFLSAPESAPYTVTKHAALGFAEWVAINFGLRGIQVCAVCPEAVDTQMLQDSLARSGAGPSNVGSRNGVLSPRQVAEDAVLAVKNEQFLATTHPHTLRHVQGKWTDIDKWIRAMNVLIEKGD